MMTAITTFFTLLGIVFSAACVILVGILLLAIIFGDR